MANRSFHRKQSLDREVKDLFLEVSFGATGAPTIVHGLGIASISRTSQGLYLITLEDKYYGGLKFVQAMLLDADAEDLHFQVKEESIASAGTISLFTVAAATATDPSNGSKAYIQLVLKNNTIL